MLETSIFSRIENAFANNRCLFIIKDAKKQKVKENLFSEIYSYDGLILRKDYGYPKERSIALYLFAALKYIINWWPNYRRRVSSYVVANSQTQILRNI